MPQTNQGRNRFEGLHDDGGTARNTGEGEGKSGVCAGGGSEADRSGTGGGEPTPEESAAAATAIASHYRRHQARGSVQQRREARAKEKATEAARGAKAMMARM